MAKRLFGLVWFAFEPFGKLPKVINELPVEVLGRSFHAQSFFCRPNCLDKRRRSCLDKRVSEPPSTRRPAQSIRRRLNSYNFDAGLDYDYTTGFIVCTIAAEIVRTILQPGQQTAQLFEQKFYGLFEHMSLAFSLKASKSSSIVSTKAFCLATTNLLAPRSLDSRNYSPTVSRNQKI
jgi:hypothetical protein